MNDRWAILLHDTPPSADRLPAFGLLLDTVLAASQRSVLDSWSAWRAYEFAKALDLFVSVVPFEEWEQLHLADCVGRESQATTHQRWRERKIKRKFNEGMKDEWS